MSDDGPIMTLVGSIPSMSRVGCFGVWGSQQRESSSEGSGFKIRILTMFRCVEITVYVLIQSALRGIKGSRWSFQAPRAQP